MKNKEIHWPINLLTKVLGLLPIDTLFAAIAHSSHKNKPRIMYSERKKGERCVTCWF